MSDKIFVRERVYIPCTTLDLDNAKDKYSRRMYDNKACRQCEHREERHSYLCDPCEAYKGKVKLYEMKSIKGKMYVGVPTGDKRRMQEKLGVDFSDYKVIDKRTDAPFDHKIKFILDLRKHQEEAVSALVKCGYGLLEAPPRTGKTAMALATGIRLGQKFVVLANQHEFLSQFLDHIHGNEKEGIPKFTNLPELEKKVKKKLYGFPKTDEDFENFQIFVMTYQQYLSEKNGKDRLKKLLPRVGTLIVDEAHKAAASEFARVIQMFPVKYRIGVTATVDRKDGRQFIIKQIFGPINARSSVESLIPNVYVHETGFTTNKRFTGKAGWVRGNQALGNDKNRNKFILDYIMTDLAKGHNIVIPVPFKKQAINMMEDINKQFGRKICDIFVGGGGKGNKDRRKQLLTDAKAGKIRVIVGIRSLLQLGLNVPQWSCIYTMMPISNEPNYKQETSRVRTPLPGKRTPIVRLFFEQGLGISIGCARNCLKQMDKFGYARSTTPKQQKLMQELLSSSRQQSSDPVDDMYKKRPDSLFAKTVGRKKAAKRTPITKF